ncbi:putative Primosomal protein N' [Vibrio nigripulchritudo FTn2]|uniref:replication restart helicase PriA n=1 Tax=Vibrio nigripulchritudo TaxID=28173 RepID=UPI0003B19BF6|nr:primosomal protein N' [Vibrio nigripulchritudo]CCN40218.1 putative Primosomal protein N' [Vibrio nigripulchritudo FTn2]
MQIYVQVMLNVPIRTCFTFSYELRQGENIEMLLGARVRVPFGNSNKTRVAIITNIFMTNPNIHRAVVKPVSEVLDYKFLDTETLRLMSIAQDYYLACYADLFVSGLPKMVRDGKCMNPPVIETVSLVEGATIPSRAKKQCQAAEYIMSQKVCLKTEFKKLYGSTLLKTMLTKGFVQVLENAVPDFVETLVVNETDKHCLNDEQQNAFQSICEQEGYGAFLLDGVTGSGKTEVYFAAVEKVVKAGKQVLVLVPEISLTPQLLARFESRFGGVDIGVYHSKLNDTERAQAYNKFRLGISPILIGTRSCVFAPAKRLGLIIVDEEHDSSIKNADKRFGFHGRDLAVLKASVSGVPVVLGSASPSFESIKNSHDGKYKRLFLNERATKSKLAPISLIDIKGKRLRAGLCDEVIRQMKQVIREGNQCLVYLNRRGANPLSQCEDCGYVPTCKSCDKPYHFHLTDQRLHCHVCGSTKKSEITCKVCHGHIQNIGIGTQKIESDLKGLFPEIMEDNPNAIVRVDSDSTAKKKALSDMIDSINGDSTKIILGTQLLSKGHHFPKVALVVVVDVDGELMSTDDVRSLEVLSSNIIQVSGRSGRSGSGRVLIQTRDVNNPYFKLLATQDYRRIADVLMEERRKSNLPPYAAVASVTVTSFRRDQADSILQHGSSLIRKGSSVNVSEPHPSSIRKRAGMYSESICVYAANRKDLNKALRGALDELEKQTKTHQNMNLLWDFSPLYVKSRNVKR